MELFTEAVPPIVWINKIAVVDRNSARRVIGCKRPDKLLGISDQVAVHGNGGIVADNPANAGFNLTGNGIFNENNQVLRGHSDLYYAVINQNRNRPVYFTQKIPYSMLDQIQEATRFIQSKTDLKPAIGIILGTGLGALANEITVDTALPYETIPYFPLSTVEYHAGKLIFGTLSGKSVVVMQGRFHFYEGYTMLQITFPVRVMQQLGVQTLLVSNAAGGLNPEFATADLMVIEDHISLLLPQNPLTGPHDPQFGDRWPDMSEPYRKTLIDQAFALAPKLGITLQRGVYVSVTGPQLETRAEYRMLRQWGADAVGMSTVPEVIVAHQMGMAVFGVSVITDMCLPDTLEKADINKIIAAAGAAEPKLTALMRAMVEQL